MRNRIPDSWFDDVPTGDRKGDALASSWEVNVDQPVWFETLSRELAAAVREDAAARDDRLLLHSFRALLLHEHPPVELLKMAKSFAKLHLLGRASSPMPWPVARALYLASIAAAWVCCNQRISRLSDERLGEGLTWAIGQTWIDNDIRKRLIACRAQLGA